MIQIVQNILVFLTCLLITLNLGIWIGTRFALYFATFDKRTRRERIKERAKEINEEKSAKEILTDRKIKDIEFKEVEEEGLGAMFLRRYGI